MKHVIVCGALGRMGSLVCQKLLSSDDLTLAARVDVAGDGVEVLTDLNAFRGEAHILIDFSHHTAAPGIMAWAEEHQVAVIMCTTGHEPAEEAAIREAGRKIPVFYSANMSLGIALLAQLAKKTAALFPDADIEIVEVHHNRKVDAPSGTALMLFNAVKEVRPEAEANCGRAGEGKRTKNEIGISALRMGNVVGIHEVHICTGTQTLTLKHEATTRAMLADGAVDAARFMVGKAIGLYNMENILG